MSLLITVETGGVLNVVLGGIPVVGCRVGSGGGSFGVRGVGGYSWEGSNRARCICPFSISNKKRLISSYTLNEESVVGLVDGGVISYLATECLIHVLVDVLHDSYIAKVAFGQEGGHSFSVLSKGLLAQLFVFHYLFLCLDGGVNHHVGLPQSL